MNKIKLIVSDLDGTLSNSKKEIDKGILETINKLKEKNISFTLASGRNNNVMKEELKLLNINVPYITDGGSKIYLYNELLKSFHIDKEYNNYLVRKFAKEKLPMTFFYQDTRYRYLFENSKKLSLIGKRLALASPIVDYDTSMDIGESELSKITVDTINYPNIDKLKEEILEVCPNIEFKRTEDSFYTVLAKGINKGVACKWICDYLNIDKDELMCIGDNYNDLPLFDIANVKVAMLNSDEGVKKEANYITEYSCEEDGVSKFLNNYFSI